MMVIVNDDLIVREELKTMVQKNCGESVQFHYHRLSSNHYTIPSTETIDQ